MYGEMSGLMIAAICTAALAASIFGGGAMIFIGGRFIAKSTKAGYWRSVDANLRAGLVGLAIWFILIIAAKASAGVDLRAALYVAGVIASLVVTGFIVKKAFAISFAKAILASLPALPQAAFLVPVLALALVRPSFVPPTYTAYRPPCKANLKSISSALQVYANDYHNEYPLDLQTLVKTEQQNPATFHCPACPGTNDANIVDYFYFPANLKGEQPDRIVICDFAGNHKDKFRNCLFGDFHIDEVTEEQFQKLLGRPDNAEVARALAAAEATRPARP